MRISRGRVDLVVAQELADHAQALAEGQCPRREAVAIIPNSE